MTFGYPPSAQPETTQHTPAMLQALRETGPWVRFISIMMFIGLGLMALGGLAVIAVGDDSVPFGAALGLVYLLFAGLYIAPAIFLSRYASAIKEAVTWNRTPAIEEALRQQRAFWRFTGIGMAALLGLYAVIFLGAMVFGVASAL